MPKPSRTKRGTGAGAKLAVGFDYYVAADGVGPDHGYLHGKDDYGDWELLFEGEDELRAAVGQVLGALREVAVEAREEAEAGGDGVTVWLKAVGAQGDPIKEVWWDGDPVHIVDFPYRPKSVKDGDLLILYAAGKGVLVGVARVIGDWYRLDREVRWPWATDTELLEKRPLSQGVPLDVLAVERAIGKSIRQKSHVRLRGAEPAAALDAFGLAA